MKIKNIMLGTMVIAGIVFFAGGAIAQHKGLIAIDAGDTLKEYTQDQLSFRTDADELVIKREFAFGKEKEEDSTVIIKGLLDHLSIPYINRNRPITKLEVERLKVFSLNPKAENIQPGMTLRRVIEVLK